MARSTEDLQAALEELRAMHPDLEATIGPRIFPLTAEMHLARELKKVHDFCGLLLDEVLELRGDQA